MNDCRKIEPLLWEYPDGGLSDEQKAQTESHLKRCQACRAALVMINALRESSADNEQALSHIDAAAFDEAVFRKIRGQKRPLAAPARSTREYNVRMAVSFGLAAVIVLFMVKSISDIGNFSVPASSEKPALPQEEKNHSLINLEFAGKQPVSPEGRKHAMAPIARQKKEEVFSILPAPITAPAPDSVNIDAVYLTNDSIPNFATQVSAASLAEVLADTGAVQTTSPRGSILVSLDKMPRAVGMVLPEYPVWARKRGLSAVVWVKARIDREGNVSDVEAMSCSLPGVGFEEAALKAAKMSKFAPAEANGKAFPIWVVYPVKFIFKD